MDILLKLYPLYDQHYKAWVLWIIDFTEITFLTAFMCYSYSLWYVNNLTKLPSSNLSGFMSYFFLMVVIWAFLVCFWDRDLHCSPDWPRTCFVTQTGFELMYTWCLQTSESWNYCQAASYLTHSAFVHLNFTCSLIMFHVFDGSVSPSGFIFPLLQNVTWVFTERQ